MDHGRLCIALACACLLGGCTEEPPTALDAARGAGGPSFTLDGSQANVSLSNPGSTVRQLTSSWAVAGSGVVDPSASTVTWTIRAPQDGPVTAHLIVNGQVTIRNSGSHPAPLGNIVVHLQVLGTGWSTQSSNVADATREDAATSGIVLVSSSGGDDDDNNDDDEGNGDEGSGGSTGTVTVRENDGSGTLTFRNATTNAPVSLSGITLAPGASVDLGFTASYNNNVLGIAADRKVRAKVVVTFGNAGSRPGTAANVDIDGSGTVDTHEATVGSAWFVFHAESVPAATPNTDPVSLSAVLGDISTTGTVSFSSPRFDLGATTGTVIVTYDPGTSGGSITNCARLTGTGFALTTCDTQPIVAPECVPGDLRCRWEDGQVITYSQTSWSDDATASALLVTNFFTVFSGGLEVGGAGAAEPGMSFTNAFAVLDYLPAEGPDGPLTSFLVDPTTSESGRFGGELVALRLNIDFADFGITTGTAPLVRFGDLRLCNPPNVPTLNGITVRQLNAEANELLAGKFALFSISELAPIVASLNGSFEKGTVSTFARDHLVNGPCPARIWQQGDMITYTQATWGDGSTAAGALLAAHFDNVYAHRLLRIGRTDGVPHSLTFTNASAVLAYLPQAGPSGFVLEELVNPVTSTAGAFGGEVLALRLNFDFSGAGITAGNAGVAFGRLTICRTTLPAINGRIVGSVLLEAQELLGGREAHFTIAEIEPVLAQLNASFAGGGVTAFAQDHLFAGFCP